LPEGTAADVIRGCYHFKSYSRISDGGQRTKTPKNVTLLGSGAILTEVIKAAQLLVAQGVEVDVFSVTSWSELARDGRNFVQRRLAGDDTVAVPFIAQQLQRSAGPIIAATDYVCALPESIRAYLPEGRTYVTLGTDGFGRSDTRAALRRFFAVDADSIAQAAVQAVGR
jgi:pyruvate dehydrogenase E1 component